MRKRTTKPTQHDVESEFLPSASGFDAEFRCLGKRALCSQLPREEDTAITRRGQRIHDALAESDLSDLAKTDEVTASRIMYAEAKLVHEFDFEGAEVTWEQRFWDTDDDFNHTWSCRIDTLHNKPKRLLVADNKTGWGIPPPIDVNWQVRSEAALLAGAYYDVEEAVVALIHPHHPDSLYEVRVYTKEDLADLLATVRHNVAQIHADADTSEVLLWLRRLKDGHLDWSTKKFEGAEPIYNSTLPRTPGGIQCQFCTAKRICPEYLAQMAAMKQAIADEIADEGFTALIRKSPKERGEEVRLLREMQTNIKLLMEQYVEMSKKDGTAVHGFTLRRRMLRTLTNEGDAMELIREEWGEDALVEAMHVSLPDLEKALAKKLATAKDAKAAVQRVLSPVLKFKPTEYWLEESRSL